MEYRGLGYFLEYKFWNDAIKLLETQLKLKRNKNFYFKTLSFFHYDSNFKSLNLLKEKDYFNYIIKSELFYGLKDEFFVIEYPIPKPIDFFIFRRYKFLSMPLLLIYYTIGLYLLNLMKNYFKESGYNTDNIQDEHKIIAFYGGYLNYSDDDKLISLDGQKLTYYYKYNKFKEFVKEYNKPQKGINRIFLKLDIENYFENISIRRLLTFLFSNSRIDSEKKRQLKFDQNTIKAIEFFFRFYFKGTLPQSDNNIISSFLSFVYLIQGDKLIRKSITKLLNDKIVNFKIIRYVDDYYLILDFRNDISIKDIVLWTNYLRETIADNFYTQLGLRFNNKSRIYFVNEEDDRKLIIKSIHEYWIYYIELPNEKSKKNTSNNNENKDIKEQASKKVKEVFNYLKEINEKSKQNTLEELKTYFDIDKLKLIFGNSKQEKNIIYNLISENQEFRKLLSSYDFEIFKFSPKLFIIILFLLKDEKIIDKFLDFYLKKEYLTFSDLFVLIEFLNQIDFDILKYNKLLQLFEKLLENKIFKEIFEKIINNLEVVKEKPGYFNLSRDYILKLSQYPIIIEQIKLRVLNEKNKNFSVALNHLVNEFQTICYTIEKQKKTTLKLKNYDSNKVKNFLYNKIDYDLLAIIKNMFKRRNINLVSHAGTSEEAIAYEVTIEEYYDFHNAVSETLEEIKILL